LFRKDMNNAAKSLSQKGRGTFKSGSSSLALVLRYKGLGDEGKLTKLGFT
jgi:hypothetical protein